MTIQELDYFIEVARVGSIGQAGANLYVSPQAISKAIKNLENSLKHELFSRNSKGVRLTVFGEAFLQEVLPIMQSIMAYPILGKSILLKKITPCESIWIPSILIPIVLICLLNNIGVNIRESRFGQNQYVLRQISRCMMICAILCFCVIARV